MIWFAVAPPEALGQQHNDCVLLFLKLRYSMHTEGDTYRM